MSALLGGVTEIAQNMTLMCTLQFCLGLTRQAAQIPVGLILDTQNALLSLIILTCPLLRFSSVSSAESRGTA